MKKLHTNIYIWILIIIISVFLLAYMIIVESEPGLIPLVLLITGLSGFIYNSKKIKILILKTKKMKSKNVLIILSTVVFLLSFPLIAMQFTAEVNWDFFDFLVIGILLFGTGLLIDLVLRKVKNTTYRILTCVSVLFVLFLIWAELAVGIFGSPFAGS